MLKVIWISDNDIRGNTFRFLKIFSDFIHFDMLSGKKAEEVISKEMPELPLYKHKGIANLDMMDRLAYGI